MGGTRPIWFWMFVGSTVGGFIPDLWGDSFLSLSSIALSALGSVLGIWIGYKRSF